MMPGYVRRTTHYTIAYQHTAMWLVLFLSLCPLLISCSRGKPPIPTVTPAPIAQDRQTRITTAPVIDVIDGSTIDVNIEGQIYRVRYLGIEIQGQTFVDGITPVAELALELNRFMVEGRTVELEKGMIDSDAFGNLFRYVYVSGEMVNLALLTNGYATVASYPPDFEYRNNFIIAEETAKTGNLGMWKNVFSSEHPGQPNATPTSVPGFNGGTLPQPPGWEETCDFSKNSNAVIKGNIDSKTGERIYHVPGGMYYTITPIKSEEGDRWFCTEAEAQAAGWQRSAH